MFTLQNTVIGIAWYREEGYASITELMGDGASFPKTYASWRQKAVRMERELQRRGMKPVRIDVEPGAFARWCKAHESLPDAAARSRYVEEMAGLESAGRT